MDDMQSRIAARRAEIERERAQSEASKALRQADAAAATERDWAERVRAEKERIEEAAAVEPEGRVDPANKGTMDRMVRQAVSERWNDNQRKGVGATVAAGVVLLFISPVWGVIVLGLGAAMYKAVQSKHWQEMRVEYPDLFPQTDTTSPELTLWQKLWWKPEPPKQ